MSDQINHQNRTILWVIYLGILLAVGCFQVGCMGGVPYTPNTLTRLNLAGVWMLNFQESTLNPGQQDLQYQFLVISSEQIGIATYELIPGTNSGIIYKEEVYAYEILDSGFVRMTNANDSAIQKRFALSSNGDRLSYTAIEPGQNPAFPDGIEEVYDKREILEEITFWINAFIPGHIPDQTRPAPAPYQGTMIEVPVPFYCALTDNRTFSADPDSKSRMHSMVSVEVVDPQNVRIKGTPTHRCDPTTELRCSGNGDPCRKTSRTNEMDFSEIYRNERFVCIDLDARAKNPCALGWANGVTPYIDYCGTLSIDLLTSEIEFYGDVDGFPAFEAYVSINGESAQTLFREPVKEGKSVFDLFGDCRETVYGKYPR